MRLLFNSYHPPALQFRHAKPLWVGYTLEQNLCATALLSIIIRGGANISLNNVVTKDDADWAVIGKMLNQGKCCRDPTFAFLLGVVEVFESDSLSVAE